MDCSQHIIEDLCKEGLFFTRATSVLRLSSDSVLFWWMRSGVLLKVGNFLALRELLKALSYYTFFQWISLESGVISEGRFFDFGFKQILIYIMIYFYFILRLGRWWLHYNVKRFIPGGPFLVPGLPFLSNATQERWLWVSLDRSLSVAFEFKELVLLCCNNCLIP